MIITTSRKPSSKIRTFCKNLSRFTGWKYVPRGKSSFSMYEDETLLLIGEHRGNPGSFTFFSHGVSALFIHASVSMDKEIGAGPEPVIEGSSSLALELSRVTGLKIGENSRRAIRVDDQIEFIDNNIPYIILKPQGTRGEGIV